MKEVKVLVVEDDIIIQRSIKKYLVNNSFIVFEADNGEDAIERYIDQHIYFDVIIIDIMMPKLNGLELLVYIRKLQAYSQTKLIGITSGYKSYLESLCDEKFDFLLNKPLDFPHLVEIIQKTNH